MCNDGSCNAFLIRILSEIPTQNKIVIKSHKTLWQRQKCPNIFLMKMSVSLIYFNANRSFVLLVLPLLKSFHILFSSLAFIICSATAVDLLSFMSHFRRLHGNKTNIFLFHSRWKHTLQKESVRFLWILFGRHFFHTNRFINGFLNTSATVSKSAMAQVYDRFRRKERDRHEKKIITKHTSNGWWQRNIFRVTTIKYMCTLLTAQHSSNISFNWTINNNTQIFKTIEATTKMTVDYNVSEKKKKKKKKRSMLQWRLPFCWIAWLFLIN